MGLRFPWLGAFHGGLLIMPSGPLGVLAGGGESNACWGKDVFQAKLLVLAGFLFSVVAWPSWYLLLRERDFRPRRKGHHSPWPRVSRACICSTCSRCLAYLKASRGLLTNHGGNTHIWAVFCCPAEKGQALVSLFYWVRECKRLNYCAVSPVVGFWTNSPPPYHHLEFSFGSLLPYFQDL